MAYYYIQQIKSGVEHHIGGITLDRIEKGEGLSEGFVFGYVNDRLVLTLNPTDGAYLEST